jgi:hypothetical protein
VFWHRREVVEEIAKANGIPHWLARLEPIWALAAATVCLVTVAACLYIVIWTVALLVG